MTGSRDGNGRAMGLSTTSWNRLGIQTLLTGLLVSGSVFLLPVAELHGPCSRSVRFNMEGFERRSSMILAQENIIYIYIDIYIYINRLDIRQMFLRFLQ